MNPTEVSALVAKCLGGVRRWRVPPNWGFADWIKEASAEGHLAALDALRIYNPSYGTLAESFLMGKVLARVLTRYRQEWAYIGRCVPHFSPAGDLSACPSPSELKLGSRGAAQENEDLRSAIVKLREPDRWLLTQLFWEGKSELEIGKELGVTQQAVSKRKKAILRNLRQTFDEPSRSKGRRL